MPRLSKKERIKIEQQMTHVQRGATWVGIRPCIMNSKKYDKKRRRREDRCLDFAC